jgi:hypothetical protein
MDQNVTIIETTAGNLAAELMRRGIRADERLTVIVETSDEIIPGRTESRARIIAAGLTDADIDRLIKEAQKEVEPNLR